MSIRELENNLLDIISSSAIKGRVREIELLPDVSEKSLINRFETKAPAIYISYNRAPSIEDFAYRKFSVVCLARNSRSHQHQRPGKAAQHGDSRTIGVFEMVDFIEALINSRPGWQVKSDQELRIDTLSKASLYGMAIELGIRDDLGVLVEGSTLEPFRTYTADHSLVDGADEPITHDHITLEQ